MKRMTAMLLALGLLVATLTGCQGGVTMPETKALAEVTVGSDTYPPFVYMDENGDPTGIGVAFSLTDRRGLAQQLDDTLAEMRADGTMKEIVGRYLEKPDSYLEVDGLDG